jgi:hypothetical protein
MKTTIKGLIKAHLIKVCKEKTAIMRERQELKPKKQITKKATEEAVASLRKVFNQETSDGIMHALSILLGTPEISQRVFALELFGVLVLGKNTASNHAYPTNSPLIITNHAGGSNNWLMHTDGSISNWHFTMADEPRLATDAEIVDCIDSLTDAQWRVIITHDLFSGLVKDAMSAEVDVLQIGEGESVANGDSNEIETNGRRITIGKE